jgi:hypothetical protein
MDREASKGHTSTREEQQQQHEVSSAVASRSMTVIVRFPMAKPRMRLPPAPINKEEKESGIRHSNDTNPVIKILTNTNGEAKLSKTQPILGQEPPRCSDSKMITHPQTQISPPSFLQQQLLIPENDIFRRHPSKPNKTPLPNRTPNPAQHH